MLTKVLEVLEKHDITELASELMEIKNELSIAVDKIGCIDI
jgi:hypothetical protein